MEVTLILPTRFPEGRRGKGPDGGHRVAKLPLFSWAEQKGVSFFHLESTMHTHLHLQSLQGRKEALQCSTFVTTDFWKESYEFYRGWLGLQDTSKEEVGTQTLERKESLIRRLRSLGGSLPKHTVSSLFLPFLEDERAGSCTVQITFFLWAAVSSFVHPQFSLLLTSSQLYSSRICYFLIADPSGLVCVALFFLSVTRNVSTWASLC